jgi:hypothetical protein
MLRRIWPKLFLLERKLHTTACEFSICESLVSVSFFWHGKSAGKSADFVSVSGIRSKIRIATVFVQLYFTMFSYFS